MPSFAALTAALALAGTALATPVDLGSRSTFTVAQTPRRIHLKNGAAQMARTLRKFGKPVPEYLARAAEVRAADANQTLVAAAADGSDPAVPSDEYDSSYLSPVTLGSNTVHLDFDTGSADLPTSQTSGHDVYQTSSGKALSGYTWKISYGDGSGAAGKVYADKVVVGPVTATSQAVEAATSVSAQFAQDVDTDGLLGLAFSSINTVSPEPQTTFFDTVKDSLASPIFAANLKYHASGSYDFGYIDSSKYTGSVTYTDVDSSDGFWGLTASGYAVGSAAAVTSAVPGIADTGTTLLYLPTAVVSAYYAKVSGATNSNTYGGYVFSCSATLPDFSLVIGGVKQRVPGRYINYSPVSSGSSTCFGGIQANTGIGFSIFGDIFLKSKYVIHDASVPRIGFADQPDL